MQTQNLSRRQFLHLSAGFASTAMEKNYAL